MSPPRSIGALLGTGSTTRRARTAVCHAVITALVLAATVAARAQDTPSMPRSVKRTIELGTRRPDGRPGPRYWQNRGRYTVDLMVFPPSRTVRGAEQITYVNNSPDTLAQLVIKLFMNSHKPGAPRALAVEDDYLTSGVQIDSFAVNATPTAWRQGEYVTSVPVALESPLLPHDTVGLSFRWHYDLSKHPAREGVIDSTTFYIAYFYPRVAVYDDYNGWDTMDFADLQEFYSDFNDYDVTVHVPANFLVWGTGTLTNAAQVLQPTYFRRFTASLTSDSTIRVATGRELLAGRVTAPGSGIAWHFTASNIPDVAFGLSDHYDWDAASAMVEAKTSRRVSVQAAYNDTAADFHFMVQMARHSLDFLSTRWPGVSYPYEKTTVFQGGAGMEYPMMVNDDSYPDTSLAYVVAGHEIAHTYMPFYMGINETRYAFMDEGWATTFDYLINQQHSGSDSATRLYQQFRIAAWAHDPSPLGDVPIITPADALKGPTYRYNAYGKASLGYLAVKEFLGDSLFRRALHAYIARWHGKHPTPWDFFNTFNVASGRDLNWFWNNWYCTSGHIDLAVRKVARVRGGYTVTLDNIGSFDAPVDLALTFTDGSTQAVHQTIGIWERNQKSATIMVPMTKTLQSLRLVGGIWMDADTTNDAWSVKRQSELRRSPGRGRSAPATPR